MSEKYYYEYEDAGGYCYSGSHILINKLNITDANELYNAEREITALSLAALLDEPVPGSFDFRHLKAIHREIFKDLYSWAGETRKVNIVKGNRFCDIGYIDTYANKLYAQLQGERYLMPCSQTEFPARLAYYLGEINTIHPFREGNGRAQRLFIEYLAKANGYIVDFSSIKPEEMIEASASTFVQDYRQMTGLMKRILSPCHHEEVAVFIQKLTRNRGPVCLEWRKANR